MDLVKRVQIDKAINTLGGKWPGLGKHDTLGHAAGIYFSFDGRSAPLPVLCTRAEFEARKAERQNKPSWSECPDWAHYVAQDSNGDWHWFSHEPRAKLANGWNSILGKYGFSKSGKVIGDWRSTLEQRPNHIGESDEKGAAAGSTTSLNEYHAQVRQRFDAWADGVCAKLFPEPNIDFELTAFAVHPGLGGKMLLDKVQSIINEATTAGNSADWYNYDKQEATKLPPVGAECIAPGNSHARIIGSTASGYLIYQSVETGFCEMACQPASFRPLDWNHKREVPSQSPELSFHLANAFNELQASARLLPEDDPRRAQIVALAGGVSAVKEVA